MALTWNTYAGGTSAVPGKYSYDAKTEVGEYHIWPPQLSPRQWSYTIYFANTKGILLGGLWQNIGSAHSPQSAKKIARIHYERIRHQLESVSASHRGMLR
jgi:hypothetical protein